MFQLSVNVVDPAPIVIFVKIDFLEQISIKNKVLKMSKLNLKFSLESWHLNVLVSIISTGLKFVKKFYYKYRTIVKMSLWNTIRPVLIIEITEYPSLFRNSLQSLQKREYPLSKIIGFEKICLYKFMLYEAVLIFAVLTLISAPYFTKIDGFENLPPGA